MGNLLLTCIRVPSRGLAGASVILAIDPGVCFGRKKRGNLIDVDGCACAALTDEGRVDGAWFDRYAGPRVRVFDHVAIERPQYDKRSELARVQDLIGLAWDGAILASSFGAPVTWYTPTQWKQSEHKPAQHARLWSTFTDEEKAIFPADSFAIISDALERGARSRWKPGTFDYPDRFLTHDLLDAVALGRHHLSKARRHTP
jgi:hypothetical protein